ncbi:MAG: biotin transporter BioY [Peptococcia bacterium]
MWYTIVIGVTYLYGIIRFYLGKPFTFWQAVEIGMLPFLILDLVKGLLAALVARGVLRRMRHY